MSLTLRTARLLSLSIWFATATVIHADERRAPPPEFSESRLRDIFFEKLDDAFPGERPTLSKVRASIPAAAKVAAAAGGDAAGVEAATQDKWSALIVPASLEDEVKRVRLHFDSVVTTPAAFKGGGYLEARLDLTVLAMLFAVINEHSGEVRWKDQATVARDLIARTAFNCKAGSTQVYNEARLRQADLQDLVSGSGLASRDAAAENDWSSIAARSPLMEYSEQLIDALEDAARNEASVKESAEQIKRYSELLAVIGEVLIQEGMDEADDGDYVAFSRGMTESSKGVTEALGRMDFDAIRQGASAIRQRCDACHEQYR